MNLMQTTLASVLDVLQKHKIDYLMVGGHVVNHYGYARFTGDIDLMMMVPDANVMVEIMQNAGFTSYSVEPLVLFFKKPEPSIRVDFLRTDPGTFAKLLYSAQTTTIMGYQVKIPSLPDLLAMKFFSYGQSPATRMKDLLDIISLSTENKLDPETVLKPLAQKYATDEVYQQVCLMLPPKSKQS